MALGRLTHVATTVADTTVNPIQVTIPDDGSVVVGDLLLWASTFDADRDTTVTGIVGFTAFPRQSVSGHQSRVWYKIAEAEDLGATISVTNSGALRQILSLVKITGADPVNPLYSPEKYDSVTNIAQGNTSSLTDVAAGSRILTLINSANTGTYEIESGYTRQYQASTIEVSQECSLAWADSDSLLSGSVGPLAWTHTDGFYGSSWILAVQAEATGSDYENSFSDTEGLTDTVGFVSAQIDSVSETEEVTDTLSLVSAQTDTLEDSLGLTDSLSLVLAAVEEETVGDTLGLTDSVSLDLRAPRPASYGDTLVMGPAQIFIGDFGAPEPEGLEILNDPSSTYWTVVGATTGGLQITVEQEYKAIEVRQISEAPARRIARRKVIAQTELAEPTLLNLLYVLNSGTMASGAGFTSYSAPPEVNEATPLDYRAVIVYGWAPGVTSAGPQKRRAVILRKCISSEGTSLRYGKDYQTLLTAQWTVHYVDSTTPSFHIIDEA